MTTVKNQRKHPQEGAKAQLRAGSTNEYFGITQFMKTNLVTLLMVVGTVVGLAQTKDLSTSSTAAAIPPGTSGARIQFAETIFDFGKVSGSEVVKHDFVFTNVGTASLEIKDVQVGCGCTTAGTWDRQVEPGQTGVIPLQFNPAGFSGTVMKPATVTCNDPGQSNVVLYLKSMVWKPFDVVPATTIFNVTTETQTNETRIVRIVSNLEEPVELSDLQCTNRSLQAELKSVLPGKEFELRITAVPPFTSNTIATVNVKTSSPRMPLLNVGAYLLVQPSVIVAPNQIVLPTGRLAAGFSYSVKILNKGTNSLALSDPKVNSQGTEVRLQEVQPGQVFSLMVNFPAGFQTKPDEKAEVTVKSNHRQFPLIKIPVIQQATLAQAARPLVPAKPSPVAVEK